jgi:hypothetical protein
MKRHDKTHIIMKGSINFARLEIIQEYSLLPRLFHMVVKVMVPYLCKEKWVPDIKTEKEEVELSLFANTLILCVENPKESTKILLKKNQVNQSCSR